MKILKLTFVLCFLSSTSFSQLDTKNQIDIVSKYLQNYVYWSYEIEGGGSIDIGNGFCLGINYNRKVAERLWINTGINYLKTLNDYNPPYTGIPAPTVKKMETELLRIPVKIRLDLLKLLYLKTGLTVDSEISSKNESNISNQSGIGYSLALGLDLKISELIYFNIEPELSFTSLIPFNSDKYQEHFLIYGINFNIGLRF